MPDDHAFANPKVTLDLLCSPDAAKALAAHPALKRPKARRPRARAFEKTWHDTSEFALAERDLALAESAGTWHLEGLGLGWPRRPGTATAMIAASVHPAGLEALLGQTMPGPLRPVGRLSGQILRLTLPDGDAALECRLVTGTLAAIDPYGEMRRIPGRSALGDRRITFRRLVARPTARRRSAGDAEPRHPAAGGHAAAAAPS